MLNKCCRLDLFLLLGLVGLGFALRSAGLGFGLPNESRQDEWVITQVVMNSLLTPLMHGDFSLNPHFFIYPSLYLYGMSVLYLFYFWWGQLSGIFPDWQAFMSLYQTDATSFQLMLRWASVASGTASIIAMYALGRAFLPGTAGRSLGLLSATLMTTSYLCIRNSHFGTLDIPLMLGIILSLWAILQRRFRLASLLIGLSIGLKYRAITLLIPLGFALWQRHRETTHATRTIFVKHLATALGIVAAVFVLTSPWSVLDFQQFQQDIGNETAKHLNFTVPGVEPGWIFYPRFALSYGLGLLVCLLAVLGIVRQCQAASSWKHWALLAYLLVSYAMIGSNPLVMTRYALPLVPVVLLYAALGLIEAIRWLGALLGFRTQASQVALASALLLIAVFQPLTDAVALNRLLLQPDTRDDARAWILNTAKPGDIIATGPWYGRIMLPFAYRQLMVDPAHIPPAEGEVPRIMPVDPHTWLTNTYHPTWLRQQGVRYVVLYQGLGMFANPPWEGEAIAKTGRLVAHWSPLETPPREPMSVLFDPFDAFYAPYSQFQGFQRPGPEIFIFDLAQKPLPVPKPSHIPTQVPDPIPQPLQQPKALPLGEDGTVTHE